MTLRVLLVQNEIEAIRILTRFFVERGDEVWHTNQFDEALTLFDLVDPDLLVLDMHFSGHQWLDILKLAYQQKPELKVIITNKKPDLEREYRAQNYGVRVFLRQPFTKKWLERAMWRVERGNESRPAAVDAEPRKFHARFPLIYKIFLPYLLLVMILVLVIEMVDFIQVRDLNQRIVQSSVISSAHAVQWFLTEEEHSIDLALDTIIGQNVISEAMQNQDAEALRSLLQNSLSAGKIEAIEVLNQKGDAILSIRQMPWKDPSQVDVVEGETFFREVEFVKRLVLVPPSSPEPPVSGLVQAPWGDLYYVGQAVFQQESFQGLLLAGVSLKTLNESIETNTRNIINIYDDTGTAVSSTLPIDLTGLTMPYSQVKDVIVASQDEHQARKIYWQDQQYLELFLPWKTSDGQTVALLGVSSPYQVEYTVQWSHFVWILLVAAAGIAAAFGVAWLLNRRLIEAVKQHGVAVEEIARGNLEIKLPGETGDELDQLSRQVNTLVTGIQDRLLEHDILGVSKAFEPGETQNPLSIQPLLLEGREIMSTLIHIRPLGFKAMVNELGPKVSFESLNALYQVIAGVTADVEGIVTHFEGESLRMYFDLFNPSITPAETVLKACKNAKKMRDIAEGYQLEYIERGLPVLYFSAQIDTQKLAAGVLHLSDRLHYAVTGEKDGPIDPSQGYREGDTQNLLLVTQAVVESLAEVKHEFHFFPWSADSAGDESPPSRWFRLD
jgi:CheY-like chemotaxis protein/HAMP domain-containing protein